MRSSFSNPERVGGDTKPTSQITEYMDEDDEGCPGLSLFGWEIKPI
jgi:hypothetical protein